jgi:hypothetical protein
VAAQFEDVMVQLWMYGGSVWGCDGSAVDVWWISKGMLYGSDRDGVAQVGDMVALHSG